MMCKCKQFKGKVNTFCWVKHKMIVSSVGFQTGLKKGMSFLKEKIVEEDPSTEIRA